MAKASTHSLEGIRRTILDGFWSPGDRLQPTTLAEQFSTSTTVIRESLTRLAGENLVTIRPNRGFFVPDLNLSELADITELRCVTEALAAKLAAERGTVSWESSLIAIHHKLSRTPRRLPEEPDRVNPQWSQAHREFHHQLLAPCECQPMLKLSGDLANFTELYRRWAAPSQAAVARDVEQEHADILDAALARDAEKLGQLLRNHYQATVDVVMHSGLVEQPA
ncbi:GntR family transcriptional regulator [Glutamicibacter ardleyensis]|uniref:GntR family transcriptional regulator n=1 Tax=Glutamicibacter ardleyensis TaxID=225894 RepID=A0ABQ2D8M0_9MICC|nr:GntR family transcriptional regulator [Glutamicibacter ardleyensis]GGJ48817.1 GntR family transcriptional regulator [Glutamicibacter ardleyensis]